AALQPTVEEAVERAKRAFALKKYEEAVDHYATALEVATAKYGHEDAPELADLYLQYGKALLENAISQSSVLGKEGGNEVADRDDGTSPTSCVLSFSGDAEEDPAVDLFAQAAQDAIADDAEEDGEGEGEDGEPEDDFNAAWEVLDLARAIYEKQKEDEEVRLKLADTLILLGDVSLETEKFDQAITDYAAGLELKVALLPVSSRQIAEAHYKLSMVLDMTSGRLSDAIMHVQKALESVDARLHDLKSGLSRVSAVPAPAEERKIDAKGKGKGTLARDEEVSNMSRLQIEAEIKDLSELRTDLALKVEELKTSPNEVHMSAPEMAAKALDQELNDRPAGSSSAQLPVNDLTSMVVRKKKLAPAPEQESSAPPPEKRKAEDSTATPPEKKARLDEAAPA
ncbi:hypothetical protein K488DRAFT_43601, partial [Vararia minispora EC-137]